MYEQHLFCANIWLLIFSFLKVFKRQKEFAPKQRVFRGESLFIWKNPVILVFQFCFDEVAVQTSDVAD